MGELNIIGISSARNYPGESSMRGTTKEIDNILRGLVYKRLAWEGIESDIPPPGPSDRETWAKLQKVREVTAYIIA